MWALIWSLVAVSAANCPLQVAVPGDALAVQVPIRVGDEHRGLPRGSLVRLRSDLSCTEGTGAEVLSVVYFYAESGVQTVHPGDHGCLSEEDLAVPMAFDFIALPAPPGDKIPALQAGHVLRDLVDDADCEAQSVRFGEESVSTSDLRWVRALSPSLLTELLALQEEWTRRYGPALEGRVWLSDWGFLSLPMLRYRDSAQLHAEWIHEDLESPAQRERAVSAVGPSRYWLHFLGSDARFSDLWARPETVSSLAELAQAWSFWCVGQGLADRERCTLQIGDLAWYNPRIPDPLGHKEHFEGECVDLRLFRKDGSHYEAYWNRSDDRSGRDEGYDRPLTQAFVQFALGSFSVDRLYFNDPDVAGAVSSPGHDDHIHFCFTGVIEPSDE